MVCGDTMKTYVRISRKKALRLREWDGALGPRVVVMAYQQSLHDLT